MMTTHKGRITHTKMKIAQVVVNASMVTRKATITLPRLKFMEIDMEKKYGPQKTATDR